MKWKTLQLCALVACAVQAGVAVGQLTFTVSPENQPAATAPAATLNLYSELNLKLAAGMDGADADCVKSYGEFQGCKASGPKPKCGKTPVCSVTAPLTMAELSGIRFHFAPGVDAATLVPIGAARPVEVLPAAPTKVPKDIKMMPEDDAPPGASGGTPGGVMGGLSGSSSGPPVVVARPAVQGPARISGGVSAGNIVSKVQPSYPPLAKVMHLSGMVVLRAMIAKTGMVDSLQVVSATNPVFESTAVNAVRQWVYRPYMLNGEPTMVDTTVTVNFTLGGG